MTENKLAARGRLKVTAAKDLRKYTQQIWLAGLGAFSRAEEEGGKLFDSLVKVGEELESKTREIADNTAEELRERVIEKASDTRDKVERALDDQLNNTRSRLGIASQKDIEQLSQRIDGLTQVIEDLVAQLNSQGGGAKRR